MLDPAYQGIYPIPQTAIPNSPGSAGAKQALGDINLEAPALGIEPTADPIANR